jgi:hypothetical protein
MRQIVNKYGLWIIGCAFLLALISAAWTMSGRRPPKVTSGDPSVAFYLDEATGEESVGPADVIFPLPGKSGQHTVVQAFKFDLGGAEGIKTVYLLKYSPSAVAQMDQRPATDPQYDFARMTGKLVRRAAAGSPWVEEQSPEGQEIENNIEPGSSGKAPKPVYPKR